MAEVSREKNETYQHDHDEFLWLVLDGIQRQPVVESLPTVDHLLQLGVEALTLRLGNLLLHSSHSLGVGELQLEAKMGEESGGLREMKEEANYLLRSIVLNVTRTIVVGYAWREIVSRRCVFGVYRCSWELGKKVA